MKKAIRKPTIALFNPKGSISTPCAGSTCIHSVSPGTHAYILLNEEGKFTQVWHPQCYTPPPSKTEWMRQVLEIVDSTPDVQRQPLAITYDIAMSNDHNRALVRRNFSAFLQAIREKEKELGIDVIPRD